MTAIKHTIQHQVFLPSEERLIAVVHVTKTGKKKKASFLCAAGESLRPPLNKKVFPVHRPGGLKRADWDFFFMIFEKSLFFSIFLVHSSQ